MKLICINCPRGCHLDVNKNGEEITVSGNACPRGYAYASSEMTNPLRMLTTTVSIDSKNCHRLPVISSGPLPKGRIMDAMRQLKNVGARAPIAMGDVVVKDILGLNVDIIASKSIEK